MHYTIGELAKVVNLSTDAIRYYEEVGLLLPHHVDPVNRYRYYTPEQIGRITEIIEWKECGLTLEEIRNMQDPNAKVVMCSGRGTPEVVQECLMSGVAEFVAKPFLPHVLADAVAAAVQSPAAG